MSLLFTGTFKDKNKFLDISIILYEFMDEDNVFFVYSPHLDISGYGKTPSDAKESFKVALDDFLSYTLNKKTLHQELIRLGWKADKKKIIIPKMQTLIQEREFLSQIFDKYPIFTTRRENVGIPTFS